MGSKAENNQLEGEIKLKWFRVILIGLISLSMMLIVYSLGVSHVGEESYSELLEWINGHFSLRWAVFLYAYVVDTLILPLSPDLVWVVGAAMVWWEAILLAGLGSALGGISSCGIGVLVDKIPLVKKLTESAYRKWGRYIRAYGLPLVFMSALLPMPFSTICLVAGIVRLNFTRVVLGCLLRIVHAAIYYHLFRAGLLLV